MKLKEAFDKKRFVVTSEVQPPAGDDPRVTMENLRQIRGRVDGFSVADIEVEGIVGDSIKTCNLLQ